MLKANTLVPEVQDDSLTSYAAKLTKQEANINWSASAELIERQIRGLSPWPVAYTNSLAGGDENSCRAHCKRQR